MNSRARMKHRCTVLRDANAGTEVVEGYAATPNWGAIASGVPCYAWVELVNEFNQPDRAGTISQWRMIVPSSADITGADQVADVVDRRGESIAPGPFAITSRMPRRRDHVLLILKGGA